MLDGSKNIDTAIFIHVRMVISMIVALSVGKLMSGLASFVQHPTQRKIDALHLLWVGFTFLAIIQFWWWEFYLSYVDWTLLKFISIILYVSCMYFLCALLFPDTLYEYQGFSDFFMSRRHWFFGLLIAFICLDVVDTWIKGITHLEALGWEYWARAAGFISLSAIAIKTESRIYHTAFVGAAIAYQLSWGFRYYGIL